MEYLLISAPILVITLIMVYVISYDYIRGKLRERKIRRKEDFNRKVGKSRVKKNNRKYRLN